MDTALVLGLAIVVLVALVIIIMAIRFPDVFRDFFSNIREFELGLGGIKIKRAVSEATKVIESKEQTQADPADLKRRFEGAPSGKRVLWVDDNPGNNAREEQVFKSLGIEVDEATTNEEAVELLGKKAYDLIISDIGRKGPESRNAGLEIPDRVAAEGISVGDIVYYTGHAEKPTTEKGHRVVDRPSELFWVVFEKLQAEK